MGYNIYPKMSAFKEIKQRLDQFQDAQITQMDLTGIKIKRITPEIKAKLEEYQNVKVVILAECELESLENLPTWKLNAIDISSNNLGDDVIKQLAKYTDLAQIIATSNNVTKLESLKALSALKSIIELDFSQNPVSGFVNYRETLFMDLTSLEILDRKDNQGKEVPEEEQFLDQDDDEEEEYDGDDEEDYEEDSEEQSSDKGKKKKK